MSVDRDADLERIVARRWRLGALLTAVMMTAYFGFILLVAFAKPTVGTLLADDRISLGIVFLWFGGIKFIPGWSPAAELAGGPRHLHPLDGGRLAEPEPQRHRALRQVAGLAIVIATVAAPSRRNRHPRLQRCTHRV